MMTWLIDIKQGFQLISMKQPRTIAYLRVSTTDQDIEKLILYSATRQWKRAKAGHKNSYIRSEMATYMSKRCWNDAYIQSYYL